MFDVHKEQTDRRDIANIRMRLFRTAGYMNPKPGASAKHVFDQLVLESLGFLTPDVKASIPLDAITITALAGCDQIYRRPTPKESST